jgi:hypothetical protein
MTTITDFYAALDLHDWYSAWSDDSSVYLRGDLSYQQLKSTALSNGPAFAWLLTEFSNCMFSGPAWETEKLPKPSVPRVTDLNTMIDIRADYEKKSLEMAGNNPETTLIAGIVRCMSAASTGNEAVPVLFQSVDALRNAWMDGKREASEALIRLKSVKG